ncbi:MAG: GntR family transcriptional regulator, partial [Anaeroplasmataceae bacterium]|nr:GntR family transcriptional regulator [Anaeroplasmataceae bacterium]
QLIQYNIFVGGRNMQIKIGNKKSIYIEVADKIESFIRLGVYTDNEKLPSCRKLGLELGVNPNTIERAYSLLEERGIVYTIFKKGIFVCPQDQSQAFIEEVSNTIMHFKSMGVSKSELIQVIENIYEEGKQDDKN